MRVIRGYRHGQRGGGCLVMIDEAVLPLPTLGPHERRHSPEGFQWGYSGAGPAELARAILMILYPQDPVVRSPGCYQVFKAQVIARLTEEGFTLTSLEVDAWYRRWQQTERGRRVTDRIADEAEAVRRLEEIPQGSAASTESSVKPNS